MAPRKAAKKTAIEVPTVEGKLCLSFDKGKELWDIIRKMTEIVPKGTGNDSPQVRLKTVEGGLEVTYAHFGYGCSVVIPVTNGGVSLNNAIPLETLTNLGATDIVALNVLPDGSALNVRINTTQIRVRLDDADGVDRQVPDFLSECFDSFKLSDAQFDGLLKQVVFKSTDLSVKGTGLPVRIKSDVDNQCYHVVARDSAFGVIKSIPAEVSSDVDITLAHTFLKVISDAVGTGESVTFGFSDDMGSCRTKIGDNRTLWAPVPLFEEWDLLEWRTTTLANEETLAELNAPFNGLVDVLDTIVPHFKLDDQTNNVRISVDTSVQPENILIIFESNRVAVGGRAQCSVVKPMTEQEIITDGRRMAAFLKCGKGNTEQASNLKLFQNHLFVNIPESRLEFILPLR